MGSHPWILFIGFFFNLPYRQGGAFQTLTKKKNSCREVLVKYKGKKKQVLL
jgi:hypothetical protein